MATAADVIVSTLEQAGVEKIFGVVGTSTLDLADAIARTPALEFISGRTEEGAAHMADGYARASGRVGVVLAHVGPGALRQMYGVGTAWKDSVPLLVLTGNEIMRATDGEMREGYHVIDVQELYRPITKATLQLRDPDDAYAVVRRALWLAASGRPGPVLLDMPKDRLKSAVSDTVRTGGVLDRVPVSRPLPDPEDVRAAADAIAAARIPVLLAGGGVQWAGATGVLARLAERCNLPVVTTDGGRGAVGEDHPTCLGVVGRQAGDTTARTVLAEADVIVAVGTPLSDVSTFEWSAWPDAATVLQVDVTPDVAFKGVPSTRPIVADAAGFLTALHGDLDARGYRHPRSWAERREAFEHERASYLQLAQAHAGAELVSPWVLIEALDAFLPRDALISVDSGMHSFYGKKLRVVAPRTYIRSAGFGAMGYSFPALMGALEGGDASRAVAIMGDGCMAMCLGEFETAARLGSPVTVLVYNDARFASQRSHQQRRFDGRVIGTEFQVTDFVRIAEAQGVTGWTVDSDDQARRAIEAAVTATGPNIIDARIDPAVRPATWIEGSGDTRLVASEG